MQIKKNHVVTLHYKLTEDDANGEFIEETYNSDPLIFIYGIGMMVPAFEQHLEGKNAGDRFSFTLQPEDAYGDYDDNALMEIPIENFADESGNVDRDKLVHGTPITLHDPQGNGYTGVIAEVKLGSVVIDFNHPMSGRTLYFDGEVLEVREATSQELDHGHVHHGGHDH
ncbi:MAG: peptidylprolyl isomerase [Saprospiraceae bacterium]|nr:peptidylprolyl isomerase [Saprospiraceae bacterium]